MQKRKIVILLLSVIVLSGFSTLSVQAKNNEDFCQEDYNRALRGDKDLAGAKLEGADLKGVNLCGADLRGAELEEADLQGADLTNANLKNADLDEANLKGAKIEGANFRGVELEYTIWVDGRVCSEDSVGSCR